jgi:hypothetical protein
VSPLFRPTMTTIFVCTDTVAAKIKEEMTVEKRILKQDAKITAEINCLQIAGYK